MEPAQIITCRARVTPPMTAVTPADNCVVEHLLGARFGAARGGKIAQCQSAASCIRKVGFGAVYQRAGMQGDLSGVHYVVERFAKAFGELCLGVWELLGKGHFAFGTFPLDSSQSVGAGQKAHGRVVWGNVVDGKPHRDRARWAPGPVSGILMPRHAFRVVGQFAEVMA